MGKNERSYLQNNYSKSKLPLFIFVLILDIERKRKKVKYNLKLLLLKIVRVAIEGGNGLMLTRTVKERIFETLIKKN
jgi:hypothetical protein